MDDSALEKSARGQAQYIARDLSCSTGVLKTICAGEIMQIKSVVNLRDYYFE